jgi:hypothetical protein
LKFDPHRSPRTCFFQHLELLAKRFGLFKDAAEFPQVADP